MDGILGLGVGGFTLVAAVGPPLGTYYWQRERTRFLGAPPPLTLPFSFPPPLFPLPQTPPQLLPISTWSSQEGPFPETPSGMGEL